MGRSKASEFSAADTELAVLAKALSHPARIAILELLAARRACICGEIVDELPLSQSTVSQHLQALKVAGLIQGDIEGPKVCYCLSPKGVTALERLVPKFIARISKGLCRKNRCC